MEFLHNRIQFSNEYFDFIRKLVTVNINLESVSTSTLNPGQNIGDTFGYVVIFFPFVTTLE